MTNYIKCTVTGQCYEVDFPIDGLKLFEVITKSEYLEYAHKHYT